MAVYHLMGILISKRHANAAQVQEILTKYGCLIKVRLGLHETGDVCAEEGLMILQLDGPEEDIYELHSELSILDGVVAENIKLQGIG